MMNLQENFTHCSLCQGTLLVTDSNLLILVLWEIMGVVIVVIQQSDTSIPQKRSFQVMLKTNQFIGKEVNNWILLLLYADHSCVFTLKDHPKMCACVYCAHGGSMIKKSQTSVYYTSKQVSIMTNLKAGTMGEFLNTRAPSESCARISLPCSVPDFLPGYNGLFQYNYARKLALTH